MPSTGSGKGQSPEPGEAGTGGGGKGAKAGSMKVRRTVSAVKVLTKSKSSGSLKKKGEQSSSKSGKEVQRTASSAEMDLLDPRMNGRGMEEGDEGEVWEQGEEKKDPSFKGMWKKAFKGMKTPGGDSKWLNRASFKRRDSRFDVDEAEEEDPNEIDPVYSLLKCAADLPKITRTSSKEGQPSGCQGAHCSGPTSPGPDRTSGIPGLGKK